jgi:choline dehydrogenase-like flavoprotein
LADHPTHAHARSQAPANGVTYRPAEDVDFAIVGSGSAGGVMARELSQAGFSVVVLEQGPWLNPADFKHDELWMLDSALTNDHKQSPNTVRTKASQTATVKPAVKYGRMVGGGSVHFTGNYWRFPPIDYV